MQSTGCRRRRGQQQVRTALGGKGFVHMVCAHGLISYMCAAPYMRCTRRAHTHRECWAGAPQLLPRRPRVSCSQRDACSAPGRAHTTTAARQGGGCRHRCSGTGHRCAGCLVAWLPALVACAVRSPTAMVTGAGWPAAGGLISARQLVVRSSRPPPPLRWQERPFAAASALRGYCWPAACTGAGQLRVRPPCARFFPQV